MKMLEKGGYWYLKSIINEKILSLRTEMFLDLDNCTLKTQIVFITVSLRAGRCGKTLFVTDLPFALRIYRAGGKKKPSFGNFLYILHSVSTSFK